MLTVSSTDAVTVTDVRFPGKSTGKTLWYRAIIPKLKSKERLPVLYFLHGANSSPSEIMERSQIVNLAIAAHLLIVIPEADYSYYTNAKHEGDSR